MKHPSRLLWLTVLVLLAAWNNFGATRTHVLTSHNDNFRTGQNTNEYILAPQNVNSNTFGKLFTYPMDGYVYAQPLYVSGVVIPGKGIHNVLYVATEHNSVYALEADSNTWFTNGVIWKASLGPAAITPTNSFGNRYNGGQYTDITNEVGITSTPVIDLQRGSIFVDAFTREVSGFIHRIHALNITNGLEQPNSPIVVAATYPGTGAGSVGGVLTFSAKQQIQRSALTLAGDTLWVAYSGYADTDPYQGWLLGYDPGTLQIKPGDVWVTAPNSNTNNFGAHAGEAGIWMGGCGIAVDENTNLYFLTANGVFNATNGGGVEFGDSLMKLSTTNGLHVADYFTPWNQATWSANGGDTDLGSGGLILVPDLPGTNMHLVIGGGKSGEFYTVNRDQLTLNNLHYNAGGTTNPVLQGFNIQPPGRFMTAPAYFNTNVYTTAWGDKARQYAITNGVLTRTNIATGSRTFGFPGCTPVISGQGNSNGVLWATAIGTPAILCAYAATNVAFEIYNSSQAAANRDRMTNGVKFVNPMVANGKVYAGAQFAVSVFGLLDPTLTWRTFHFGGNAGNVAVAGDAADPDGDGIANLMEYALGSDPASVTSGTPLNVGIVAGHLQVTFNRNASATDLTCIVESSTDLTTWSAALTWTSGTGWTGASSSATEAPPNALPPDQSVQVTADLGSPVPTTKFVRLRVHR